MTDRLVNNLNYIIDNFETFDKDDINCQTMTLVFETKQTYLFLQ